MLDSYATEFERYKRVYGCGDRELGAVRDILNPVPVGADGALYKTKPGEASTVGLAEHAFGFGDDRKTLKNKGAPTTAGTAAHEQKAQDPGWGFFGLFTVKDKEKRYEERGMREDEKKAAGKNGKQLDREISHQDIDLLDGSFDIHDAHKATVARGLNNVQGKQRKSRRGSMGDITEELHDEDGDAQAQREEVVELDDEERRKL